MAVMARAGNTIVIGLEKMNVERIKMGMPFHQDLQELMGLPYQVFIIYGDTVEDLQNLLREHINEDTVITDKRRIQKS